MQNSDEILKRLMIQNSSFLTLKEKMILLKNIDNSSNLALLSKDEISSVIKRVLKNISWDGKEFLENAKKSLKILGAFGIKYTCYDFDDYPAMLREMDDSPFMVFYRGNLGILKKSCVSVVGTRRATANARRAAEKFASDACDEDYAVVSGLAYGIDISSHIGSLKGKMGGTAAVLPCGIDTIVPSAHTRTAAKILEKGGLILSEYIPGTPAMPFRFVQRNRIIAALSPATVVVQAPTGSGAMITAGLALDYNRDVLFHKEAFSEDAKKIDGLEIERIKKEILSGKKIESKLENSPENFVKDGAFVIESFSEYKTLRNAIPGEKVSGNFSGLWRK